MISINIQQLRSRKWYLQGFESCPLDNMQLVGHADGGRAYTQVCRLHAWAGTWRNFCTHALYSHHQRTEGRKEPTGGPRTTSHHGTHVLGKAGVEERERFLFLKQPIDVFFHWKVRSLLQVIFPISKFYSVVLFQHRSWNTSRLNTCNL